MHNNYYFLRQLGSGLQVTLTGTVISECFSQNKDELVIRFETHDEPFWLKASLEPGFSHISFPREVQRARKNSVDLFQETIGRRIQGVRQFENERSFAFLLEDERMLLFRMHGNRSNIILTKNETVADVFKSNIAVEEAIRADELDRSIDWRYETFLRHRDAPAKLYFTLGKIVWLYLNEHGYQKKNAADQWKQITDVRKTLEDPSFYLTDIEGTPHLTLLPFDESWPLVRDPVTAANVFFQEFSQRSGLAKLKGQITGALRTKIRSSENYLEKSRAKLNEIRLEHNYRVWADLIMANLHSIRQGEEMITLPDFYKEGNTVEIRLKKDLTPQANAAVFYRKAKNQHLETERIEDAITAKEKEIAQLRTQLAEVEEIDSVKTLRQKFAGTTSQKEKATPPYHEFVFGGFRIWVGKNAQQNDELTLRHAYKEDLWLHAKDVPGSHVVIKHQSGKKIPKEVIQRAAELAAYNSKRKTESLCPVIVTPRKFVRKRKGDPAGTVVVEREDVIMVEPRRGSN